MPLRAITRIDKRYPPRFSEFIFAQQFRNWLIFREQSQLVGYNLGIGSFDGKTLFQSLAAQRCTVCNVVIGSWFLSQ